MQASYPHPSEGRQKKQELQSHSIQNENYNHRKLSKMITWIRALCNSMKLWAMPCRATQGRQVMVERSDRMWSTRKGNGEPLQHSCLKTPMNSMKRQEDMTPGDELTRSVGVQYDSGKEQRNSSRKNEEAGPKWKWCSVVDVSGGESKVRCCKEQYCIGINVNWTWSSRRCEHRHFRNQWTKMGRNGRI